MPGTVCFFSPALFSEKDTASLDILYRIAMSYITKYVIASMLNCVFIFDHREYFSHMFYCSRMVK